MVLLFGRMSATREIANRGESTSPGLSSPPSPNSPTRQTATPTSSAAHSNTLSFSQNGANDGNGGGEKTGKTISAKTSPVVRRKPRKKKEPDMATPNTTANTPTADNHPQEVKVRKRAPRGTSEAYKKKQARLQEEREAIAREAAAREADTARQPKITDAIPNATLPPSAYALPAIHTPHQKGNNEAIQTPNVNTQNLTPLSRPLSGQNYDPIRSSTVAPRPNSPLGAVSTPQKSYHHSSASASPSIYSIIDHPTHPYAFSQPPKRDGDTKMTSPPESKRPCLSPPPSVPSQQSSNPTPKELAPAFSDVPAPTLSSTMDIDEEKPAISNNNSTHIPIKKPSPKTSSAVSSSSHSPKPSRPKESAVAMSSGSGLLSGTVFGGGYDNANSEKTAPTVVLNVPLTSEHQYVNFTRLAEERYGFNALHPRLAAQRERLARVAAAGAALENANKNGNPGSADDMSVDLSDADADNSNVEMGGMNDSERNAGTRSGEETGEAGTAKKPRKRMMKEDMYDKEDDFIDDTELIWEEQAATSKDGFFVYSGPLIPPGEEPTVERYFPSCFM